jgi:hypothetical protein
MNWTMKWVDPLGVETVLTNSTTYKVIWGSLKGMSGPPFNPITQGIPLKPGSFLKNIDVDDNEIDMTVMVTGTSETDLWNQLTALVNLFNPLRGDGTLKVTPPHGMERWLTCRCISGFRLNEPTMTTTSVQANLVFSAFNPYWRSTQVYTQTTSITGSPPQWFPIFPLRLGGDAVVSEFTINNTGHVETYPTWVITGPGQNPKISNLTTGEFIGINPIYLLTLGIGDTITIDTENRIVQDQAGEGYLDILDYGSSFFTLAPGNNTIRVEMSNATTASSINLSYRLLYLGVV